MLIFLHLSDPPSPYFCLFVCVCFSVTDSGDNAVGVLALCVVQHVYIAWVNESTHTYTHTHTQTQIEKRSIQVLVHSAPPKNSVYVWADSVYIQVSGLFCSEEEVLTETHAGDICQSLPPFHPAILPVKCDAVTSWSAKSD